MSDEEYVERQSLWWPIRRRDFWTPGRPRVSAQSIVAFIEARLSEREAVARDAVIAEMSTDDHGDSWDANDDVVITAKIGSYVATGPYDGGLNLPTAEHIAANDPAYVLADIQAKRRILALHRSTEGDFYGREEPYDDAGLACTRCGTASEYAAPWPCDTVKLLAQPFSGHPDWRSEWALDTGEAG